MGPCSSKSIQFTPSKDIPSLHGKVILVTGGNSGLGKQSILELSKHNPHEIWLAARSPQKASEAITDIRQSVPNAPIKVLEMDLMSFDSIRSAARTFSEQSPRLDILLLNAGIMAVPPGTTEDGYEIQFGTNHMGHALLIHELLPTLLKTAEEGPGSDVRVVVVGSAAHNYAPKGGVLFQTLKDRAEEMSTVNRYGQSKLANILYGQELARRHPAIKVPIVHPGMVRTNLGNTMASHNFVLRWVWAVMGRLTAVDVETGALNQLWASTGRNVLSGEYYEPVGVMGRGSGYTRDARLARDLWEWTESELDEEKSGQVDGGRVRSVL